MGRTTATIHGPPVLAIEKQSPNAFVQVANPTPSQMQFQPLKSLPREEPLELGLAWFPVLLSKALHRLAILAEGKIRLADRVDGNRGGCLLRETVLVPLLHCHEQPADSLASTTQKNRSKWANPLDL